MSGNQKNKQNGTAVPLPKNTISFDGFNNHIKAEIKEIKSRRAVSNRELKVSKLRSQLVCKHEITESGRAATFGFYDSDACVKCGYECFY